MVWPCVWVDSLLPRYRRSAHQKVRVNRKNQHPANLTFLIAARLFKRQPHRSGPSLANPTFLNQTMQPRQNSFAKLFGLLLPWLALALPVSILAHQHRQELSGAVQRVIDGDTLVLLDATQTRRTLRLAGIDAPESRMRYGQQATAYLAALAMGHEVVATTYMQDRYGRSIATLKVDGKDVNLAMIQTGLAWHYTKYAKEQPIGEAALYAAAQQLARAHGLGLWRDECPVAPWAWRQGRKSPPVKILMAHEIPTCIYPCL